MKRKTLVFALLCISMIVNGQKSIKKMEIEEIGYHVQIEFDPIINLMTCNGIELKIKPISTNVLNEKLTFESNLNGLFDYTYYDRSVETYFLKSKKKYQKTDFAFYVEGLDWLLERKLIDNSEYISLYNEILTKFGDISEIESVFLHATAKSNPYFINGKYLSLFMIEFSNASSGFKVFDSKLVVEAGNSILLPLGKDFLIQELIRDGSLNNRKSFALERHNFDGSISIPPKSTISKYFSVLPIDYDSENIEISIDGCQRKMEFEINKSESNINEKFVYYVFNIEWTYGTTKTDNGENFVLLSHVNNKNYYMDSEKELYLSENEIDHDLKIIAYSMYQDILFFKVTTITPSSYINFDKNRRENIPISMDGINVRRVVQQ